VSDYPKFLPQGIPAWQQPYWQSLRDHAVEVQKCDNCGTFRYTPKELCNSCHATEAAWTPISGEGNVYTYTIVRRAPTPAYQEEAPYVIVHVDMAEGFRMIGSLTGVDPENVRIGQRVKAAYQDATPEWTLLTFQEA
jgi:uncharacterized protein